LFDREENVTRNGWCLYQCILTFCFCLINQFTTF
jgi:hypothetical protein